MTEFAVRSEKIKVAIIEDRREIRDGLAMLVGGTDGFVCTAKFGSMEEALPRIKPETSDIVLCDIGLPGMSGIDGIKLLKEKFPDLLLIMLTVYDDDERIFNALCAGASGYLLKKTPPAKLLEALREAFAGGSPMSPEVARRVINIFRDIRPPEKADYNLTPHETRLLKMLVEGHNYTTAAEALNITYSTVSFHMRNIYDKLQVHSKSEAVGKALRDKIV
jgi:DNA-binding NarL/FixJ family response regulator